MKINIAVWTNLRTTKARAEVKNAGEKALKKVVVAIASDVIKGSPYLTGNNRRSIMFEAQGLSGSVYSTSGYGGGLETGTAKRPATPYFKPALDKHIGELPAGIKAELGHG